MIKFDMSEEIILSMKVGVIGDSPFKNSQLLRIFLDKIYDKNFLIISGASSILKESICFKIIREILYDKYERIDDLNVFKVRCIDELEVIYSDDRFQIFYLDDFFGEISLDLLKFKNYINKIICSKNKVLIASVRDLPNSYKFFQGFSGNYVNLRDFKEDILNREIDNFDLNYEELECMYSKLFYIDKFILFSVCIDNLDNVSVWIKITKNYFLGKRILREDMDFDDLIVASFKKLENKFIHMRMDGRFYLKDNLVHEFLMSKIKIESDIIKDLITNIYSIDILERFVCVLKDMRVKLNYSRDEYINGFKSRLFDLVCVENSKNLVGTLKLSLDLFDILGIFDFDVIGDLNNRIIYSNMDLDKALEYVCFIKDFEDILIKDGVFEDKIKNLIYGYSPYRDVEFYNYNFRYFLFVDQICGLYPIMEDENILDIKNNFYKLVDLIFNNVNFCFTLEYFNLSTDMKSALIDLKVIIKRFNVRVIFSKDIDKVLADITYSFLELLNDAVNFKMENKNHYYVLRYFKNEIEMNKDFLEFVFEDVNLDFMIEKIKENIYSFRS